MEVLPHPRVNGVSMNGYVQSFEENRQSLKSGSANVNVNKSGTVYPDEKRFFSVFLLLFFFPSALTAPNHSGNTIQRVGTSD